MDLAVERQDRSTQRQRRITGRGGCGLCGMDSLAEALRTPPRVVSGIRFFAGEIQAALDAMPEAQQLNVLTRAAHAA
jgi:FdhD protein